jgi:predicted nucleic acid-binding Zn ribbon protein
MEHIGRDVQRELRRFSPHGAMPAIVAAWPGAVGETIARNAWPARIGRDGTLFVHASSSTWAFELSQLAPTILERLAAELGDDAPALLRFSPGRVPEPLAEPVPEAAASTREPTRESLALARSLASVIDDEELRERVARAAALSLSSATSGRSVW